MAVVAIDLPNGGKRIEFNGQMLREYDSAGLLTASEFGPDHVEYVNRDMRERQFCDANPAECQCETRGTAKFCTPPKHLKDAMTTKRKRALTPNDIPRSQRAEYEAKLALARRKAGVVDKEASRREQLDALHRAGIDPIGRQRVEHVDDYEARAAMLRAQGVVI